MVTTFYPPYSFGGDGMFVHRLSNQLAERGHQVDVVHCEDAFLLLNGGEPSETAANHPGVRVHGMRSKAGALWTLAMQQTGGPAFEAARLRELLEREYDVIHFHNVSLMGGPKVLEYGSGVKLYTMHEYWLVCPTHVLFKFNREPCRQPSCFACTLAHRRPPQLWRYTRRMRSALGSVDAFLALSQFSIDTHRRMGLDVGMRLLPPFAPQAADAGANPRPPGPDYFLFVGRLEKIKGLHQLIPLFGEHGNRPPELPQAELWIAGSGSQEAELRRLAAGNPRVRFLGYVHEPRLSELYRNAVALVVPSLCYEVFPLVLLEAFRQRTPVLVRRIGGMTEVAESSAGGAAFADTPELAALMRQLLADPDRRDALGRRGYEAFQRCWTPEAHLARYFSIIDEAAGAKR